MNNNRLKSKIKMKIKSSDIRQKYLEFFKEKNHTIIHSALLVPENDSTLLFNVAWMQPITPYLLWKKHPSWNRLANVQKCIRTVDIDEVWDDSHLTFFEMLWNWSLGDYFKDDAIAWSYEFLVDRLKIDPKKLAVSVFEWDYDAPRDDYSAELWERLWIPKHRISYLPKSENWWSTTWKTWLCGPDTEIFYWIWNSDFPPENSNVKNDKNNWMEIWNNVFMEYIKTEKGNFELANQKNIDTGMWLERITTILNWKKSVYDTDLFENIIKSLESAIWVSYNENTISMRIMADHIRTTVMLLSDGVTPSNVEQGYILRRIMRRAIRKAYSLWFKGQFMSSVANVVINDFESVYLNVWQNRKAILEEIDTEEKQFLLTLENWLKEFGKLNKTIDWMKTIAWNEAFRLYDTYGFPLEITIELARKNWLKVDEEGFKKAFEEHQANSRTWAEQKFKGGLADYSEDTTALHSATHLMLAWLRKYLWFDIHQKWSNITPERLRFDFNYHKKVDTDILNKVEDYVNEAINSNLIVTIEEMEKEKARESWVEWSFWEKYPDIVKVYNMIWENGIVYSRELCGGPHVENSKNMWKFKIKKEESSSRGVRRIKAVLIK